MKPLREMYRGLRKIAAEARRNHALSGAGRTMCDSADIADSEKLLLRRVSMKVSSLDTMYVRGEASNYLTAGLSASRCIQESLRSMGKSVAKAAILDFPCGFGRVLRFLRTTFPDSEIVGAEIAEGALEFCEREFAIRGIRSVGDFKSMSLPRKFDLIWCGSLVTHLDEQRAVDLLGFFHRHLTEDGVCIFTSHGKHVAEQMESKVQTFGLSEEGQATVLRDYRTKGFGYANYVGSPDYGISVSTTARIVELARSVGAWEPVHFIEKGWHGIQDVHAFALRPPGMQRREHAA